MAEEGQAPEPDGVTTFSKDQVAEAVKAAVAAEVSGLKGKNQELLGKLDGFKPYREALGDLDPDTLKEELAFARKVREDKQRAEGDFDSLKAQLVENHAKELDAERSVATGQRDFIFELLASNVAAEAITALEGNAKVLLPHIRPHLKIVENPDATDIRQKYRAVVVDASGKERYADGAGTPFTIKALVEEFRDNPDFAANFGAGGATGSGAQHRGGGDGRSGAHTISYEDAQDTRKYRMAREAAQKAGVDLVIGERP